MVDQLGLANEWFVRLSEPVRVRPRRSHFDHFNRNASWFNGSGQRMTGWYRPLSEPVRAKRPLPRGAPPFTFRIINMVEYRFALTEQGDSGAFTFTSYPPRNMAQVTVTAIPTYSGGTTTNVISRKRKYY